MRGLDYFFPPRPERAARALAAPLFAGMIFAAAAAAAAVLGSSGAARAAPPRSEFIGAFPDVCQPDYCPSGEEPSSSPPPSRDANRLSHVRSSPACLTDRIYIHYEYPSGTGNAALDAWLEGAAAEKFAAARAKALEMSCNDFLDGCQGDCLPVSFETRLYYHQSSRNYLSVFQAERFTGNVRRGRRLKSTVEYLFSNYDLSSGGELNVANVFPRPEIQAPLFWKAVEGRLAEGGAKPCPLASFRVNGRRAGKDLQKNDYLLSERGLTVLLTGPASARGACAARAVDVPKAELLALGANPQIFGAAP